MIRIGRTIFLWLGRNFLALLLILAILILLPPLVRWAGDQAEAARSLQTSQDSLADVRDSLASWSDERRRQAEQQVAALGQAGEERLRQRLQAIGPAIAREQEKRLGKAALAVQAARGNRTALAVHFRAGIEVALLERERDYIQALLAARAARGQSANLQAHRDRAVAVLRSSAAGWRAADADVRRLNQRFMAGARNALCRTAPLGIGCENYRALQDALEARERALQLNRQARTQIARIDQARRALSGTAAAAADAGVIFEREQAELQAEISRLGSRAGENWLLWIRKPIIDTLPTALLILLTAILAPILFKAFAYFIVAPLAARRPPIRLVPADRGELSDEGRASMVSQRIAIDAGEELLVVPEAVQSTPHQAAKATIWLLSWSMPLSSLAAGMMALIRIRSARPDFVLVSATHDPLAEIGTIRIGEGSSMVLRPRALRGIVQPRGASMRITRHWRLHHLSAWLTLQFRYLVFHGPGLLIVQGDRGVRLEKAGPGRGINQAATVGFSAGLDYSVRRSEAFGAYLLGRQSLFNDSFDGNRGYYLYEEMPRVGQKGGIWGRGLRGIGDAMLKIFGI